PRSDVDAESREARCPKSGRTSSEAAHVFLRPPSLRLNLEPRALHARLGGCSRCCASAFDPHTASLRELIWNSFTRIGGSANPIDSPNPPLSDSFSGPASSTSCSIAKSDWLNRKFFTGLVTFPFSIRKLASRVSPVTVKFLGFNIRTYQML